MFREILQSYNKKIQENGYRQFHLLNSLKFKTRKLIFLQYRYKSNFGDFANFTLNLFWFNFY
jgi:hypothetical protein